MIRRALAALAAAAIVTAAPANASVNMTTGGLRVSHTDMELRDGSFAFKIEPIYHSTSTFSGIFGRGWESQYEEYLQLLHGGIVVYEYGGGAQNLFTQGGDQNVIDKATVDQLQYDETLLGDVGRDADVQSLRSRMASDTAFRQDVLYKMVTYGFDLQQSAPAIGTQYVSRRFETEKLTRRIDGYERIFSPDEGLPNETYSLDGRLRRLWSGSDYLAFTYDRAGHILGVDDAKHDDVRFVYRNGHLARITSPHAKSVSYVQSADGNLLAATDSTGTAWQFGYDSNFDLTTLRKNHRLQETISYNSDSSVKRIVRADGTTLVYDWSATQPTADLRRKDGTAVHGVYDGTGHLIRFRRSGDAADTVLAYDDRGNITSYNDGTTSFTASWSDYIDGYMFPTYTLPDGSKAIYDQRQVWSGSAAAQGKHLGALRRAAEQVDKDLSDA